MTSYQKFLQVGIALDPIHVGAGGAHIGRVDLTIVRDPVTRIPKIPGSSLAGVYRTYVAMHYEEDRQLKLQQGQQSEQQSEQQSKTRKKPYFPDCAGLGLDQKNGHCRYPNCPVCTVFGFAAGAGQEGGFAGLAAFTDAHVLLFPVPTREGPKWVTSPMALRQIGLKVQGVDDNAVYMEKSSYYKLNLGWLLLPVRECDQISKIKKKRFRNLWGLGYTSDTSGTLDTSGTPDTSGIPDIFSCIPNNLALVPDRLFSHIVNSNLEVRTSVSINPETGAAEEGALFSYEALPRWTVLVWEIICKNPKYFKVRGQDIQVTMDGGGEMDTPKKVCQVAAKAHPYMEYLGIGGMGTRGMGRVKVVYSGDPDSGQSIDSIDCTSPPSQGGDRS
ncbi:RAMP superfamily CRISPR-associated protein [Brockia lithotrophica]|uniref:CRISPR-associated protein Cmr4 n=1 Tax=Brockia lithotrophica TaxID=933949 RepID=A0A660KXE8_9BACL|nr:RAMP superfamily CRISPR-associated protein [Brockia lithotrophica]RKQ84649.1 CRISPR-associated protein Cmr4 [Brockia lithotrophica]